MRMLQRAFTRGVLAIAAGALFAASPAAAAPVPEVLPVAVQCLLRPGVYGITDSSGQLVGLLIIYPDCRMEVYRKAPE